eukprot:254219_1
MLVEMSGRRPTTIGFSKAPVSKALVFVTATSSIAALSAFQLRSTDIVSLNVNFIIHKLQLWRLITSNVVSGTPGDLFFSITLLYIFRMFERQFGSRKFASAILFFFAGSTILQSVMQIMDLTTPATSGPHAAIFGLLVQYICDIPTTSRLNILGVSVSDKLPTYITAFMYATRQAPSSWVVALCGIAMGALFRSDQLPFSKFRVPNFASDFCNSWLGPLLTGRSILRGPGRGRYTRVAQNADAMSSSSAELDQLIPGGPPPARQANPDMLTHLLDMGFDETSATAALINANNDLPRAVHLLAERH